MSCAVGNYRFSSGRSHAPLKVHFVNGAFTTGTYGQPPTCKWRAINVVRLKMASIFDWSVPTLCLISSLNIGNGLHPLNRGQRVRTNWGEVDGQEIWDWGSLMVQVLEQPGMPFGAHWCVPFIASLESSTYEQHLFGINSVSHRFMSA